MGSNPFEKNKQKFKYSLVKRDDSLFSNPTKNHYQTLSRGRVEVETLGPWIPMIVFQQHYHGDRQQGTPRLRYPHPQK